MLKELTDYESLVLYALCYLHARQIAQDAPEPHIKAETVKSIYRQGYEDALVQRDGNERESATEDGEQIPP